MRCDPVSQVAAMVSHAAMVSQGGDEAAGLCIIQHLYVIESTVVEHNREGQRKRDLLSFRLDVAHQV